MTQEEKARAYDKVRKKIAIRFGSNVADEFFAEFEVSKDEEIRKALLEMVHDTTGDELWVDYNVHKENALAWLEKQGKHKPIDKVESNFHEGDWVVYKCDVCQIVKREEGCNKLVTNFGIEKELVNERNLSTARLWTIRDAKDGDVLAGSYGTFIFMGKSNGGYCGVLSDSTFIRSTGNNEWTEDLHPATKEQRDLLFQKMNEMGYEWDVKKKEFVKNKVDDDKLREAICE